MRPLVEWLSAWGGHGALGPLGSHPSQRRASWRATRLAALERAYPADLEQARARRRDEIQSERDGILCAGPDPRADARSLADRIRQLDRELRILDRHEDVG